MSKQPDGKVQQALGGAASMFSAVAGLSPLAWLAQAQARVRASYWFIPSSMAFAALWLALLTLWLDRTVTADLLDAKSWMFTNTPAGARSVLSTISASMITVAGVTFSVTIAAIATTTSQFGPRLLTNFMQDRGNQWTLGTFLANFVYCLMVLRGVRAADESEKALTAFVPHLSVLLAVLLALTGVAVLIFFLNHVPQRIHISNVIARVGHELDDKLAMLFPSSAGESEPDVGPQDYAEQTCRLASRTGFSGRYLDIDAGSGSNGYVQHVACEELIELASERDLFIVAYVGPGDFVSDTHRVARVYLDHTLDAEEAAALTTRVRVVFAYADSRNPTQDVLFLVDELTEIAARALSPGVNDHVTAIQCVDWLGAAIGTLSQHAPANSARKDAAGKLRLILPSTTFGGFAWSVFEHLRPYICHDLNVSMRVLRVLGELMRTLEERERRALLAEIGDRLVQSFCVCNDDPLDLEALRSRHEFLQQLVDDRHAGGLESHWWESVPVRVRAV